MNSSTTTKGEEAPSAARTSGSEPTTASPNRILTGRWFANGAIGLATLEHPFPLVVRDHLVEQELLGSGVVQVVIDDVVAEGGACQGPGLERRDRLTERGREALGLLGGICVALVGRWERQLALDPVEAGCEQGRVGEVRVAVAAGDARLDAERAAVAHHPESRRPVVVRPRDRVARPVHSTVEALVRVDVRCHEQGELSDPGELSG